MSEPGQPRQIAVVRAADGYAGILRAFRRRQEMLGLSGEKIDEIAGGEESVHRYAAKWLSGMKGLGPQSWGDALGAMGMKIIFVEDEEAMRRLAKHLETRNDSQVRTIARIRVTRWLFTPRSGRKAAKRRAAKLTQEQRTESARKAAQARWERARKRRKATRCAPNEPIASEPQNPVKPLATHPSAVQKS